MSGLLYLDTETFSRFRLKLHGTEVHTRNCEVILLSYCFEEGDVYLWEKGDDPKPVRRAIRRAERIIAHNAPFDYSALRYDPTWPETDLSKWHCTMAQAYAHQLPGSLEALCRWLQVPPELWKRKEGSQRLMRLFTQPQPRTGKRYTKAELPDDWELFRTYAKFDSLALREVHKRLPRLNLHEGVGV